MRPNSLKQKLQSGEAAVSAWLSIPSGFSAELIAKAGYDCVNVDLQHGMVDVSDAVAMLQAISTSDATPIARVGVNEPTIMMKLLDAGAYGIICPMISTVDDARRFVRACRYPPLGDRSFGPARGLLYGGADYATGANTEILTIGMIETADGLQAVESIAAVDGLDALFIGPNDLSLALGSAPKAEPTDAPVVEAIRRIREAAHAAGRSCGIFCSSPAAAVERIAEGFDLVVPGHDASMLTRVCKEAVAACRSGTAAPAAGESSGY